MPSVRRKHHETLQAQLDAVREKKREQARDVFSFVEDPSAVEKTDALHSISSLLELTPEVTVLCARTGAVEERVSNANDVAEKMTREVRRLDVVQSRLRQTLTHADQQLDLRNSLAGLRRSMQHQEYAQAAQFLRKLRAIEEVMPLDVADKLRVETIESDLKAAVEKELALGLETDDQVRIRTFAPLCQAVGSAFEERGYKMLENHIITGLSEKLEEVNNEGKVLSARELIDNLSFVFNQVAAVVQEHEDMLAKSYRRVRGLNRLVSKLYELGEVRAVSILNAYIQTRALAHKTEGSRQSSDSQPQTTEEADDEIAKLDDQLNEIALVIQHTQTYERYLRSRVQFHAEEGEYTDVLPSVNTSEMGKTVQELAGYYCFSENQLLEKAADKAFQWEEIRYSASSHNDEIKTYPLSSAIDELFYVSRNSGLRALATGHVDCAAGVLNMITTLLRDALGDRMRRRIREMASHVKLESENSLHQIARMGKAASVTVKRELGPDVVMNSLSTTLDYIAQLKAQLEEELPASFPDTPAHVLTCLNELQEASSELKQLLEASRKKLCRLLEPKLSNALGPLLRPQQSKRPVKYELTDAEFTYNEANDPFAQQFIETIGNVVLPFQETLSQTNWQELIAGVATVTSELILHWFTSRDVPFNQLGALQFDKDVRAIVGFFHSKTDCKQVFVKVQQLSAVLGVDEVQDVLEMAGGTRRGTTWQLTAAEVKEALSRRVDLDDQDINQLQL